MCVSSLFIYLLFVALFGAPTLRNRHRLKWNEFEYSDRNVNNKQKGFEFIYGFDDIDCPIWNARGSKHNKTHMF